MQIFDDRRKFARYTVIIDKDVFTMSNDPSHVCGENRYIGSTTTITINTKRLGNQVVFEDLNHNVREAIMLRKVV